MATNAPSKPNDKQKAHYKKEVGLNRRVLLERTAIVWMLLQFSVFCGRLLYEGFAGVSWVASFSLVVSAGVLLASRQRISGRLLAAMLLLSIAVPIMALSYFYGGIHSPFLILILFIPVSAFMLVSRPVGWWVTLIVCSYFIFLGFWAATHNGGLISILSRELDVFFRTVSFVLGMLCISSIGWYYSRLYDRFYLSLKNTNDELQKVAAYKTQFLANMSHEFRTPLNAVVGFSRRLHRNISADLPERDRKGLDAIMRNSEVMQVMVDEILEMAKIELGDIDVDRNSVDLASLISDCIGCFKVEAAEKGLALHYGVTDKSINTIVETDRAKLEKILANLISNAVKYTEYGSVTVNLNQNSKKEFTIEVVDTGLGIAEDDIPQLFERFSRAKKVERSKISGAGLGLAVTAELANIIGARIEVISRLGEGSVFTLVLPCHYLGRKIS